MVCFCLALLHLSGLVRKKNIPQGQNSRDSCFRGKEAGIIAFLNSMAHRSVSRHVHLINSVFLNGSKVLVLFQSSYDITVLFEALCSVLLSSMYFGKMSFVTY